MRHSDLYALVFCLLFVCFYINLIFNASVIFHFMDVSCLIKSSYAFFPSKNLSRLFDVT